MKFYSLAFAVLLAMTSFAQQNNNATISSRIIHESATLFTAEYALTGNVHFNQITHDCVQYQIPIISGTGFLQHIGRPALPSFTILLADYSSEIEITFTSIQSDTIRNILIYPWIGMPVDLVGAASPQFVIDDVFYQSNTNYPKNQTELVTTQKSRGQKISMIQICPMSYNPVEKTLIIHRLFKIEVMGDGVLAEKMNPIQQPELKNTLVNTAFYQSTTASRSMDEAITYLIITSSDYMEAALAIAEWREQTGYKTEILAQPSWTSPQIFQAISQRYYGNHPPEYVLLLGDHNKVPGVQYASDIGLFPTDRIYCYMDGGNDYFPDFAIGRISVTSSQQALIVANKIINYEKTPVTLPSFYNTALAAAYFQDNDEDGYADRRFAQTAEDILQYLTVSIGKNVSRAYYTKSSITPLFWNNDYYSAGEPVPNHLKKPTFPWNGNANNIRTQINSGTFFVFHRDHGYENGWGDPAFNNTNVASLNNGNRLPVVSSVNCQTGKFLVSECFSEAFLRHANGGAVGVLGHAEVSYSGYNDALSMGVVDAMFAVPGLVPNFTGYAHIPGTPTAHDQILKMGDVVNQADLRMTQTWGDPWGLNEHQFNLFHYFGDPAMRIFTQEPVIITASHANSIHCQDSTLSINSCNIPNALATLTAEGKLIGLVTLNGGTGIINFPPTASNMLVLTISSPNTKPYIFSLSNSGNCVIADFIITQPQNPCTGNAVLFTNASSGYYTDLVWGFGTNASPQTANGQGPHNIIFSQGGLQTITLTAVSPFGDNTKTTQVWIDSMCTSVMPSSGLQEIMSCSGVLKDNGNDMPYLNDSDCETIITSPGASQITINFNVFDIQSSSGCNQAYLRIISGTSASGTIIGTYCNNNAPTGPINILNDTVTLVFYAQTNAGYDGFELTWECIQPSQPPVAAFQTEPVDPCGSIIQFNDMSLYQPFQWKWDFGDGTISTLQNPIHEYVNTGTYNVKLVVTNQHGNDSLIQNNLLSTNVPAGLNDTLISICEPQTVRIPSGNGQNVFWYDSQTSLTPFAFTDTLDFAASNGQSNLYCRDYGYGASMFTGKPNNSGAGGYFNLSTIHHLGFDIYQPLILKTVTVYASGAGDRTFTLKNGNDETIHTSTHYLTSGTNTVTLNYVLIPDNDYKLGAGANCNLYRNGDESGPDFYPYIIPGLLSINRSSAGYPHTGKYYYFFYNWEVQPICPGPPAIKEVNVHVSDTTIEAWPATSLCLADSIILSGALSGAYTWQPGNISADYLVVHQPGTYFANISTNGCNASSNSITIEGELYPDADFTFVISGADVIFTNQSIGTSWYWDFGDGTNSTDENPNHTYVDSGLYNVTLIVQNSCGTDTLVKQVNITFAGLLDFSANNISIYPNPANDFVTVVLHHSTEEMIVRVFNTAGQCIINSHIMDAWNTITLNVSELPGGLYMILIQTKTQQLNGKFFKE